MNGTYDYADPRKLLERLRGEAMEFIPERGLFSPEFQAWHAAVLKVLQDQFNDTDVIYTDFKNLQFE